MSWFMVMASKGYETLFHIMESLEQISNLQTSLQTHHLSMYKYEEMSALSDSSNLSFDSKASRNHFEIEKRADQMANKQVDESIIN